jgi:hypothetical protein
MPERRWTDPSQPQTLQGAVICSYVLAALSLLYLILFGATVSLILLFLGVCAFFIANERRWAYYAGVVTALLYLVLQFLAFFTFARSLSGLLNVLFAGVLVALLLHPMSRAYEKIWFH